MKRDFSYALGTSLPLKHSLSIQPPPSSELHRIGGEFRKRSARGDGAWLLWIHRAKQSRFNILCDRLGFGYSRPLAARRLDAGYFARQIIQQFLSGRGQPRAVTKA